jgi:hypothetical protein
MQQGRARAKELSASAIKLSLLPPPLPTEERQGALVSNGLRTVAAAAVASRRQAAASSRGSRQQPWQQAGRHLQASAGICRRELTVDAPTSRQETPGCASSQPIARSTIEKAPSVESAIFCSSAIAAKKAHFPLKVLKAFLQ